MKTTLSIVVFVTFAIWSCGSNSHEGGNQALYDEVMAVHDEVMPKMDDIYKLKQALNKKVADAPDMTSKKKEEIEFTIAQLDSASGNMMVWMRNFNPLPDSLGEENARKYLEDERIKINQVKENMLNAIDKAKTLD